MVSLRNLLSFVVGRRSPSARASPPYGTERNRWFPSVTSLPCRGGARLRLQFEAVLAAAPYRRNVPHHHARAATAPEHGIVRIHAHTMFAGDAPAHRRERAASADADDRARDRVRRRDRDAESRRDEERDRAAGLGAEAADGLQLRDAAAPSSSRCASRRTASRGRSRCSRQ